LKEGMVSAVGLDVFENEPPDFGTGLIQHPAVVSTPHLGASTEEAQQNVAIQIAKQITAYFNEGSSFGSVNALALKEISDETQKSFVSLAEVLGKFSSQLRKDSLTKISLTLRGELLKGSTKILSTAFLTGFLSEEIDTSVNYINANMIADEMGIILDEIVSAEHREYQNLIEVKLITNSEEWKFSGTVFGNIDLRIVEMNDYPVEFKPEGNILIYKNIDKPGMLSSVSSELSLSNNNIASLSLGRKSAGDLALTVVNIDSKISGEVKKSISMIDGIKEIFTVHL